MDRGLADGSQRDSDAEDAASDYSSCEGSEFERYGSANSAFGSASWCSSTGSELPDSLRSRRENRSIRDKFWRSRWNYSPATPAEGLDSPRRDSCSLDSPRISKLFLSSQANNGNCRDEEIHLDENSVLEEDGDALSGGECTEDEDSMLNYGTDGGREIRVCGTNKQTETRNENENPLLMNSSVVFGSDDWDGFVQENGGNGFTMLSPHPENGTEQERDAREIPAVSCQVEVVDQSTRNVGDSLARNPLCDDEVVKAHKSITEPCSREGFDTIGSSKVQVYDVPHLPRDVLSKSCDVQFYSPLDKASQSEEVETLEFDGVRSFLLADKNGPDSGFQRVVEINSNILNASEEDIVPGEVKKQDTCDSYDEMVLEMEEILLDSGKSYGARFTQANQGYISQHSHQFRDGSSTASTSGTDDAYPLVQYPPKIDWIEVVGAKQKKGDVSFGERLVGVKEYTQYKLRVWSGSDEWEVERRYRDFFALYRQLKTLFTENGLSLPSPWYDVERESRKIFGNASPVVISVRSTLIQNCLRSILNSRFPFGTPNSLVCFLSPSKSTHSSGLLEALAQSQQKMGDGDKSKFSNSERFPEDISVFGKTISLVVEIKPHKSMRQLLEAQHYRCAGCHRQLDAGKTLLREIVQTLGWNKPRLCEYTGQLFCSSCHTNDTAVLPARVLNLWDFSLYPVSQLAKAYLGSIYDQPMLCVSAVNPFLFSKVPALLQVVSVRKKIGAMLPFVRCPFRRSIQRGLGLRRHLLESNDFFALRDLVDLSKGAFAALPIMLETISSKIFEHITQQCLECYDAGVPCAARQACEDPSSLIFPFQESEAKKCGSCGSVFHKACSRKLMGCPCVKPTNATTKEVSRGASKESHGSNEPPGSSSTSGFFSDVLSRARPDKIWKPKDRTPVILMGSLPSISL